MRTKEVMQGVTKEQAAKFAEVMRGSRNGFRELGIQGGFNARVRLTFKTATGLDIEFKGPLAQGVTTAMEKKTRTEIL